MFEAGRDECRNAVLKPQLLWCVAVVQNKKGGP
jgi:hypothetical protein